jgi:hypothetical protein
MADLTKGLDQIISRVAIVFDNEKAHGAMPCRSAARTAAVGEAYWSQGAFGNIRRARNEA